MLLLMNASHLFPVLSLSSIDKLTKEEEEIYKLQHDLERTVISQQQSQKITEVRTQNRMFTSAAAGTYSDSN